MYLVLCCFHYFLPENVFNLFVEYLAAVVWADVLPEVNADAWRVMSAWLFVRSDARLGVHLAAGLKFDVQRIGGGSWPTRASRGRINKRAFHSISSPARVSVFRWQLGHWLRKLTWRVSSRSSKALERSMAFFRFSSASLSVWIAPTERVRFASGRDHGIESGISEHGGLLPDRRSAARCCRRSARY